MVQIIEEQPTFSQRLGRGLGGALHEAGTAIPEYFQKSQEEKERQEDIRKRKSAMKKYGEMLGIEEFEEFDPSIQKEIVGKQLQGKGKETEDKLAPFEGALETIQDMRNLTKKGTVGLMSGFQTWNPEVRKDREKYRTLGNSLISYASSIPIRNRQEFEELTGNLNNPDISIAGLQGTLDAMEAIIKRNMKQFGETSNKKERPPLESFVR